MGNVNCYEYLDRGFDLHFPPATMYCTKKIKPEGFFVVYCNWKGKYTAVVEVVVS